MIKLNLISPEQGGILKIILFYRLVKNFFGILVISAIILAIFLIPLNQKAKTLNSSNKKNQGVITIKNQEVTQKINNLNNKIISYNKIRESYTLWSELLIELSNLTPQNVTLNQFNSSINDNLFIIKGFAKTRDDLIKFVDNLNQSDYFIKIESPLSSYLLQKDITFEIKGSLN